MRKAGESVAADILAIAVEEIGYHEGTGHRNKYGSWYGLDGVAWCMEFVQWVYVQAGIPLPLKTASCGELLRWYKANQPECVTDDPVPGCIVIFDFPGGASTDHTGIFVGCTESKITTIDGNTSSGNDAAGGYVQCRIRSLTYSNPTYIIPHELEEESMERRYNTIREVSDACPWATETVAKLIEGGIIKGGGLKDEQGRPADMNLSEDMLRLLVWNDRAGVFCHV